MIYILSSQTENNLKISIFTHIIKTYSTKLKIIPQWTNKMD